ncbi:MAG: vitamin K epoxide reductase family protein [Chthoniobacterales bacterium]
MKRNSSRDSQGLILSRVQISLYCFAAVLALIGIALTTYLTALHLAGADVVCGSSADCSRVLQSPYAVFHGIPLAGLGGFAYFVAFSCATLAAFGFRRAHEMLALTIALMFGTELWLLYVQAYVLHAFCTYCLLSAALIFLLAGLILATPRQS